MDSTDNGNNRTKNGIPRVTTTPVTAKNIRHRTASSSSITTTVNKKSVVPIKVTTSNRRKVKASDGLF
jgi:hypothetical protein